MFSNSTKYAIKAVLFLAMHTNNQKRVVIKEIAESVNVPQAYLAKLLQELSRKDVISSLKGPKGGFFLSEDDRKKPCIEILVALNGFEKLTSCLLSLKKCNEEKPCPLHAIAHPLRNELLQNLNNKTIADLANEVEAGNAFLPL